MVQEFYEETDSYEVKPKMQEDKEALDRYYKVIGERLKVAREQSGYTMAKLAAGIGLTSSAVSNYESGIRQIPVHILQEFSRVLGKPLHYFLGPDVEPPALISSALKAVIERFTDALFVEILYEIKEGTVHYIEEFNPFIPVPAEIGNDQHFAVREFNANIGAYRYYICKRYKPDRQAKGIPLIWRKVTEEYIPPNPDDWVIAQHGDTPKRELIQYKNVTPSESWKGKDDPRLVNVAAIVIARLERLVR